MFSRKAVGQGCRARVHAMVQYAESMVKLAKNAVLEQSLHKKKKNNNNKVRVVRTYIQTRVKIQKGSYVFATICYFALVATKNIV
jgi:hypothetical protein